MRKGEHLFTLLSLTDAMVAVIQQFAHGCLVAILDNDDRLPLHLVSQ
jgi:hypothetical protein